MVRSYLIKAMAEGRWVGMCPNIAPLIGFWTPMSSVPFIHARMNDFVDKGIEGLIGYATPQISHCRFNTEGAAEWSWNAKGRSTRVRLRLRGA